MINSLSSERGVLAGLVKNPDVIFDIDSFLKVDDFFNIGNRCIYSTIRHLIIEEGSKNLDQTTIIATAASLGFEDFKKDTSDYDLVDALFLTNVNKENIAGLANKIKATSFRRGLSSKLHGIINDIEDSNTKTIEEITSSAESTIFDYVQEFNIGQDIKSLSDGFMDWADEMADHPREFQGIQTQFTRWDKAIGGGLRPGTVHVVGARAKAGKSALALNIAEDIAINRGIPVLYLDTELTFEYQRIRLGSLMSGVPSDDLENGTWRSNKEYVEKVNNTWKRMQASPNLHHVHVAGQDMGRIISHIRKFISQKVGYDKAGRVNDCLVIYDYLKIMDASGLRNLQEHQLLGFHMSKLHDLAGIYKIPMLVLAQLNRDGMEREDEGVIAGADKIIWYCSSFSILKKKTQEEISSDGVHMGNVKLKSILTRYGHAHSEDDYLNLIRDDKCWKFVEGKNRNEAQEAIRSVIKNQKIQDKPSEESESRSIDEK